MDQFEGTFHFACSKTSLKENWENINKLINTLQTLGLKPVSKWYEDVHNSYEAKNPHVERTELILEARQHTKKEIYRTDLIVAEVSYPSLGLGMELANFMNSNKPVLLLEHNSNYDKETFELLQKKFPIGKNVIHYLYDQQVNRKELVKKLRELFENTERRRVQIILENWMLCQLDKIMKREGLESRTDVIKKLIKDDYTRN